MLSFNFSLGKGPGRPGLGFRISSRVPGCALKTRVENVRARSPGPLPSPAYNRFTYTVPVKMYNFFIYFNRLL